MGRGCTSRSYSDDVTPDRSTLRTVLREIFRSRAISLIDLPLTRCSRRIRPTVSTTNIPVARPPSKRTAQQAKIKGSVLDADHPGKGGHFCRPKHMPVEKLPDARDPDVDVALGPEPLDDLGQRNVLRVRLDEG